MEVYRKQLDLHVYNEIVWWITFALSECLIAQMSGYDASGFGTSRSTKETACYLHSIIKSSLFAIKASLAIKHVQTINCV